MTEYRDIRCPKDRRPAGAGISMPARRLMHDLAMERGAVFELVDGATVRIRLPRGSGVDEETISQIRGHKAEIIEILNEEKERPT